MQSQTNGRSAAARCCAASEPSIALPLLDCMAASCASCRCDKPKRSVFLYIPNGVNTLTWQIEKAGKDYEFTKPLESLEKHRADVTPISGLHHPDGARQAPQLRQGLAHRRGRARRWRRLPQHASPPINSWPRCRAPSTRFASLEMAIEGHSLAWSRDGIQIPAERNTQHDLQHALRRREGQQGDHPPPPQPPRQHSRSSSPTTRSA